eukprot:IDg12247t1
MVRSYDKEVLRVEGSRCAGFSVLSNQCCHCQLQLQCTLIPVQETYRHFVNCHSSLDIVIRCSLISLKALGLKAQESPAVRYVLGNAAALNKK